jgi:hypothetical protein
MNLIKIETLTRDGLIIVTFLKQLQRWIFQGASKSEGILEKVQYTGGGSAS